MTPQLIRRRPSVFSRLGNSILTVIGPQSGPIPDVLANVCPNTRSYEEMIDEIQRFRGSIYREDGAIPASVLDAKGRHRTVFDYSSWHFLLLKEGTRIAGCMRATFHPSSTPVSNLKLHEMITRMSEEQEKCYRAAIQSFLTEACESGRNVLEAGGWAVAKELRHSRVASVLALASYSLARLLGNCLGIGSAARRNHSADILRRLGGFSLTYQGAELVPFYDVHHQGEIELLWFDCCQVQETYEQTVKDIEDYLQDTRIIVPYEAATGYSSHQR